MKPQHFIISVIGISCAYMVGFTPIVHAATFTVTKTTDSADGSCSASDCSLREAIIAANAAAGDDTITLSAGTYALTLNGSEEDSGATGDLDVTSTITLNGASNLTTFISGASLGDTILHVRTSGNFSANDVTFIAGSAPAVGGIRNNGSASLDDVIIANNTNTGNDTNIGGGGIYSSGTLTLTDCTVSNNTVQADDTLLAAAYGGGIMIAGGTASIDNCTFASNDAVSDSTYLGYGGGIAILVGTVTITNSTFGRNEAEHGGAIYIEEPIAANLTNVTITLNSALQYGGGIYMLDDGGTAIIAHSTIATNAADSDSNGTGGGGGIYIANNAASSATLSVKNSILSGNTAGSSSGTECGGASGETITSGGYNIIKTMSGCSSVYTSASTDLTNRDPKLDTAGAGDNGGSTETIPLQSISAAIDAVPAASCTDAAGATLTEDQRGFTRPENTSCDMGAYERDQTKPTITITNNNSSTNTVECGSSFSDPGATATDNYDGSVSVSSSGSVTTSQTGNYTITYSATDSTGNTKTTTRTVTVRDTADPSISLLGDNPATVLLNDTYTEAGASASDACDSSVSVTVSGSVNTGTAGTSTLTYYATDDSGNETSTTRTVQVGATVGNGSTPPADDTGNGDTTDDTTDDTGNGDTTDGTTDDTTDDTGNGDTTDDTTDDTSDGGTTDDTTDDATDDDSDEDAVTTEHGNIVYVSKVQHQLFVTYEDGYIETLAPFTTKRQFRYAIDSHSARIVATNGRLIRVFKTGEKVAQKKVNTKKPRKKALYQLQTKAVFAKYDTVVFGSVVKGRGKLIVYRLTSDDKLAKPRRKAIDLKKSTQVVKLKLKVTKKRLTIKFQHTGKDTVKKYKILKKQKLKVLSVD